MNDPLFLDLDEPKPSSSKKKGIRSPRKPKREEEKKKAVVPVLPERPVLTGDEIKRGVSMRSRSAANLKIEGFSYQEIAEMLEFQTAAEAKRAVETTLAAIHTDSDLETLRILASSRAEKLLRQSMAMASADFLVDSETGERIANSEKLRWHQQASADVMNWAAITGAKAPTKLEITPGEAQFEEIVSRMLERAGVEEVLELDVIELDDIPTVDAEEIDDE